MTASRVQQWRWHDERLTEHVTIRMAPRQRLRVLQIAERDGVGETAALRRILSAGLEALEAAEPHEREKAA